MSSLPKIAIVGYGNMGKEIEALAKRDGYIITDVFDLNNPLRDNVNYEFDVAIDFTFPDTVLKNVMILAEHKKSIVLGTTGWYDYKKEVKDIVEKNNVGLVWGSNFSIGMQMFFRITKEASRLMNKVENFDIMMHEMHHARKKDSPSGTAVSLANIIIEQVASKTKIEKNAIDGQIANDVLHVSSTRGGEVTGRHTVYIDSVSDSIELTHRAKNRSGFALGSLTAANWINKNKGFHSFDDLLNNIWN